MSAGTSRRIAVRRPHEAAAPSGRVRIDPEPMPVDNDVVVEPAQGGEVVGVGSAAVRGLNNVVGLEPIAGGAAVGRAAAVARQHVAA